MVEFRKEDACMYGDREAIMISHFRYWISKNKANGKHFHNGHYWTYNSISALKRIMPFWSEKQIRNVLASLIKQGVMQEGNFNQAGYDRTKWYSFTDEGLLLDICPNQQMDLPETEIGFVQMGKPIPIRIPDRNTNRNKKEFVPPTLEEVQEYCRSRNNKVDAKRFYDYYNTGSWKDAKGNPIANWKQKMIAVWEENAEEKSQNTAKKKGNGLF